MVPLLLLHSDSLMCCWWTRLDWTRMRTSPSTWTWTWMVAAEWTNRPGGGTSEHPPRSAAVECNGYMRYYPFCLWHAEAGNTSGNVGKAAKCRLNEWSKGNRDTRVATDDFVWLSIGGRSLFWGPHLIKPRSVSLISNQVISSLLSRSFLWIPFYLLIANVSGCLCVGVRGCVGTSHTLWSSLLFVSGVKRWQLLPKSSRWTRKLSLVKQPITLYNIVEVQVREYRR